MLKNVSIASIQIRPLTSGAPDEYILWEEFKSLRPVTREQALTEFRLAKAQHPSDCFRLVLDDWISIKTEIIHS